MARNVVPWWADETQVKLTELGSLIPGRHRNGRLTSTSTVFRWTTDGLEGIRLRRFRTGGVWATTLEEFDRWNAALTEAKEARS